MKDERSMLSEQLITFQSSFNMFCNSIQIKHIVTLWKEIWGSTYLKIYFENLKPVCTSTHLDGHLVLANPVLKIEHCV